jgi:small subunit ribosomal protein S7
MRRRRPDKREILPDPVYGDLIVAKFINNLMKMGKKSLAEKVFYKSIDKIQSQANSSCPSS